MNTCVRVISTVEEFQGRRPCGKRISGRETLHINEYLKVKSNIAAPETEPIHSYL